MFIQELQWWLNKLAEIGHLANLNSCLLTVPSLFLFYSNYTHNLCILFCASVGSSLLGQIRQSVQIEVLNGYNFTREYS